MHAFGALGLIQYWMRRVNFSCRAISLIFLSPQNMHASVISITPKYIEILFNFNQYYRSTWKAFAFCFIIPERYINFPFLWRMGVTTPADPHWNGRYKNLIDIPFFSVPLQTIETYQDTNSRHWFLWDLSAWNIGVFTLPSERRRFLRESSSLLCAE